MSEFLFRCEGSGTYYSCKFFSLGWKNICCFVLYHFYLMCISDVLWVYLGYVQVTGRWITLEYFMQEEILSSYIHMKNTIGTWWCWFNFHLLYLWHFIPHFCFKDFPQAFIGKKYHIMSLGRYQNSRLQIISLNRPRWHPPWVEYFYGVCESSNNFYDSTHIIIVGAGVVNSSLYKYR